MQKIVYLLFLSLFISAESLNAIPNVYAYIKNLSGLQKIALTTITTIFTVSIYNTWQSWQDYYSAETALFRLIEQNHRNEEIRQASMQMQCPLEIPAKYILARLCLPSL